MNKKIFAMIIIPTLLVPVIFFVIVSLEFATTAITAVRLVIVAIAVMAWFSLSSKRWLIHLFLTCGASLLGSSDGIFPEASIWLNCTILTLLTFPLSGVLLADKINREAWKLNFAYTIGLISIFTSIHLFTSVGWYSMFITVIGALLLSILWLFWWKHQPITA